MTENNRVIISGIAVSDAVFSHTSYGKNFYSFELKTPRLSELSDFIIITASGEMIKENGIHIGCKICVEGQFRSYNNYTGQGNKLLLTVYAKRIEPAFDDSFENMIELEGFICKAVILRATPLGREIADILLAVNRTFNKSDYIPCIAWGKNAKYAARLSVGDKIKATGRLQSREYQKKLDEETAVTKIAYEVSITKIETDEGEA